MKYPFLDLSISDPELRSRFAEAAARVIDSGCFVGGPEVAAFETRLAEMTGTEHAVGLSNGLDALRLSLRALIECGRLYPGDRVAVQGNTYIASVLAITDSGLVPEFIDIDPVSMLPDPGCLERVASGGAKAFMPVHLYGRASWNNEIAAVAGKYGLIVIEDNAQAIGAKASVPGVDGKSHSTGALGHVSAFSFYPTKNIGALGDAGAVTTSDPELASAVRALANYGSDRRYHNIYRGYNCRLDPMQAAFIGVRLDSIDAETIRRREIARIYSSSLTCQGIGLPQWDDGSVWHQYVVTHPCRDRFREWLAEQGVATDIHYAVPPHLQPCYSGDYGKADLPVTEHLADIIVSLPIGLPTTPESAAEIASVINMFM